MDTKTTAKALGISDRQLRTYLKRGCPHKKKKPPKGQGGKPRAWFDIDKVKDWLVAEGIAFKGVEPKPPPPKKPKSKTRGTVTTDDIENAKSMINQDGMQGALHRLRKLEKAAYKAFADAYNAGAVTTEVAAKENIYIKAHAALRMSEKEIHNVLKQRGEVIALDEVVRIQAKIDVVIKTYLMGMGQKLAQRLAKTRKPEQAQAIVDREADDILRQLSQGEGF